MRSDRFKTDEPKNSSETTSAELASIPKIGTAVNRDGPPLSLLFAEKHKFQIALAKVTFFTNPILEKGAQSKIYSNQLNRHICIQGNGAWLIISNETFFQLECSAWI